MDIQGVKDCGEIYFQEGLMPYTPPQLRGSATGVRGREDLFTRVDLTASKYEMIEE